MLAVLISSPGERALAKKPVPPGPVRQFEEVPLAPTGRLSPQRNQLSDSGITQKQAEPNQHADCDVYIDRLTQPNMRRDRPTQIAGEQNCAENAGLRNRI